MLKSLLSLFLQENCPLCDRPTQEEICSYCQKQLKNYKLKNHQQFWQGELPLFVWGQYEGKLKQSIAALKYDKYQSIGELLGIWLGESWSNSSKVKSIKSITVIPIPLDPKKQKDRGFNQAEVIARTFCQITGYRLQGNGLEKVRSTQAMFGLNPTERQANIKQAFRVRKSLEKQLASNPVLLLDDIYTTGATATEAAQSLRSKGIKVIGIAAIAKPN